MKILNLRLPDEMHAAMTKAAEDHFRSLNGELIAAIDYYLKSFGQVQKDDEPKEKTDLQN